MVYNLGEKNSIANQFLLELRSLAIQDDRMRFRNNMDRLGCIMAYEISKTLPFHQREIKTPMGTARVNIPEKQPVLVVVLRAGLAYYQGFLRSFDKSESGFIGAYRQEGGDEISINLDYLATPSLAGREIILIDPMLATGRSFIKSVEALQQFGTPAHVHVAALVATPEGITYIQNKITVPHTIWTFAIDERLNDKFYIVPGLGDAGDLSYGVKL